MLNWVGIVSFGLLGVLSFFSVLVMNMHFVSVNSDQTALVRKSVQFKTTSKSYSVLNDAKDGETGYASSTSNRSVTSSNTNTNDGVTAYPVIGTGFGTSTASSTSSHNLNFATSSLSIKNSPSVPPQNILKGSFAVIGGFKTNLQGGPVIVNNLRLRIRITGKGGTLSDLSVISLYDSLGKLISENAGYISDQIVFNNSFTVSSTTDYVVKANIGNKFQEKQTITLSANLYKDDVLLTDYKSGRALSVPKNNVTFSTMAIISSTTTSGLSAWQRLKNLLFTSSSTPLVNSIATTSVSTSTSWNIPFQQSTTTPYTSATSTLATSTKLIPGSVATTTASSSKPR